MENIDKLIALQQRLHTDMMDQIWTIADMLGIDVNSDEIKKKIDQRISVPYSELRECGNNS